MASRKQPPGGELGAEIVRRLAELGKHPAWLANRAGLARSTISRIVRGGRVGRPETRAAIEEVLGLAKSDHEVEQLRELAEALQRAARWAQAAAKAALRRRAGLKPRRRSAAASSRARSS